MAETTIPGTGDTSEAGWRDLFDRADGIVSDTTGTGLRVTADGSSTTVSILAGRSLVQGFHYESDATITKALGSLGTQPTAGQERYSRIVLRLDLSTFDATVEAITGTPATIGSAVIPSLVRDASDYDLPLAVVRQEGVAAVSQTDITDQRGWIGGDYLIPASGDLPSSPSLGTVVRQSGRNLRRELVGSTSATLGSPGWVTQGAVAGSGTRSADDIVAEDVTAAVTSVSLSNAGVGRQVLVMGTLRYRQNVTSGNVTVWVTVDGVTVGTTGPFVEPVSDEDQFVTVHGVGTSTSASPSVVLRAVTTEGTLTVRTTSRVTATAL
jgi:hypothetical protein